MGLYYVIWVSVYLICNIFLWKYVILQNISNSNSNKESYHSTCTVAPDSNYSRRTWWDTNYPSLFTNTAATHIKICKHAFAEENSNCETYLQINTCARTYHFYFALKCRIMKVIQIIVHHQVPPLKLRTLLISACASMVKGETN